MNSSLLPAASASSSKWGSTSPLSSKDISRNMGASGGGPSSAGSIAPMNWDLSVTSPNSSTC